MKRLSILAAGLLIGAAAFNFPAWRPARAMAGSRWSTARKMGDWTEVGKANWAMKDGALVADKITEGKDPSYLVSKNPTRISRSRPSSGPTTTPTAASSSAATSRPRSTPRSATRSTSSTSGPIRPTAPARSSMSPRSIRCRRPAASGTPIEITAKGPHLVVVLNGQKTVDVQDSKHAGGPFALQYGSGVIKFRKVQIKPL